MDYHRLGVIHTYVRSCLALPSELRVREKVLTQLNVCPGAFAVLIYTSQVALTFTFYSVPYNQDRVFVDKDNVPPPAGFQGLESARKTGFTPEPQTS